MGPPRELFAANVQFAIDLAEVGLESQPARQSATLTKHIAIRNGMHFAEIYRRVS